MPRAPTLDPAPGEGFDTGLMTDDDGFGVDGSAGSGGLDGVALQIREMAAAFCGSSGVPGYLAGVYHGGAQAVVAHGTANAVTAARNFKVTDVQFHKDGTIAALDGRDASVAAIVSRYAVNKTDGVRDR